MSKFARLRWAFDKLSPNGKLFVFFSEQEALARVASTHPQPPMRQRRQLRAHLRDACHV
jgi:hypothetical protein